MLKPTSYHSRLEISLKIGKEKKLRLESQDGTNFLTRFILLQVHGAITCLKYTKRNNYKEFGSMFLSLKL